MFRVLIILVFLPVLVFSQHGTKNFYTEEGLDCEATYSIYQDTNGIIWVATDNGLYSFDGKAFVPHRFPELKDNEILDAIPFQGGAFLFPFNNNFSYVKNRKLITANENIELKKVKSAVGRDTHFRLKYDSISKSSVFGSSLYLHDHFLLYKDNKIEPLKIAVDSLTLFSFNNYNASFFHPNGKFYTYNINSSKIEQPYKLQDLDGQLVLGIYSNGDQFLVKTIKGLYYYILEDNKNFKFINKILSEEQVNGYAADRVVFYNNEIWISGNEMLFYYNTSSERLEQILKNISINTVFLDRDKNIWVTTKNKGVFFWDRIKFNAYLLNDFSETKDKNILTINGFEDAIYFGMENSNIGMFKDNTTSFKTLRKEDTRNVSDVIAHNNKVVFGDPSEINITDDNLSGIKRFKDFHTRLGSFKNFSKYNQNRVLCATSGLVVELNLDTHKIVDTLFYNRAAKALGLKKDSGYVATNSGLYKGSFKNKTFKKIIPDYNFLDITSFKDTVFAFSTNANGVFYSYKETLHQIRQEDGLLSNSIKKMKFQTPTILWALSNNGVNRITFSEGYNNFKIQSFTQTDGIPGSRLNDLYIYEDILYLATTNGIESLSIASLINNNDKDIDVALNYISVNDSIYNTNTIQIPYSKESILFNVSYPDFSSYGNIKFSYKLEEEKNYNETAASDIILSSLQPGEHTLLVYGIDSNHKTSQRPLIVPISIIPRFWQTNAFKLIVFFIINALLFLLLFKIYLRRKKRKELALAVKTKLTDLEIKVIKSQINPHFIANCLNSIKLFIYKKNYAKSQEYIDSFAGMLRFNVEYSSKTFVSIDEEIDYIKDYLKLEELRHKNLFAYKISVENDTLLKQKIPTFFIQPFVENSVKYAFNEHQKTKGNIEIAFKQKTINEIEITIIDDGIGIENSKKGRDNKIKSLGTQLIKDRIESYKENYSTSISCSVKDLSHQQKQGTEVIINITDHNEL